MTEDFISALTDERLQADVSFSTVLVPIDPEHPSDSEKAIRLAAGICQAHTAKLILLTIAKPLGRSLVDMPASQTKSKFNYFANRVGKLFDIETIPVHKIFDDPKTQIPKTAKELDVDLIVMASHSPRLADIFIGSNAAAITRTFSGSVFIVR